MLVIPKRKLYPARSLMWGGLALVFASIPVAACSHGSVLYLILMWGGLIMSIIGAHNISYLYRCPACGHQLAVEGPRINAFLERYSKHCPGCGKRIEIDIV